MGKCNEPSLKSVNLKNYVNPRIVAVLILLMRMGAFGANAQISRSPTPDAKTRHPAYPLKISANRRYLTDQNHQPFLIVGDSPQAMPAMLSPAEARLYFDDRQAHGFNSVWINVLCAGPYFPDCRADGGTFDGILPFRGYIGDAKNTAHYDLTKPNQAYFGRVDRMLRLAKRDGFLVFLDPIETGQWLQTLRNNGPAAARVYGQFLGNRYKRFPNIVWFNGNDYGSWKDPKNDAVVLAVAAGIKSTDPEALQTIEFMPDTGSSLDDPAWRRIVSINGAYVYGPTYIQVLHNYEQKPTLPVFLMEAHYDLENVGTPSDYGTPSVLRREEYWAMLSGAKGQLYGNHYTWSFAKGWQTHLDTAGVAQLQYWKKFFESMPWQHLIPDPAHRVVTAGLGHYGNLRATHVSESDYCTASRTAGGTYVVAYMPTARTITVNMASLNAPATARWFDPTLGIYRTIPGSPFANAGTRQFTPPGKNGTGDTDWVLLLHATHRSPGSKR